MAQGGKLVSCDMPYLEREPSTSLSVRGEKTHIAVATDEKALKQASRFIRAALEGRTAALPPLAEDSAPFFSRVPRCHAGYTCGQNTDLP
ncbi:MAG: hypothetical protein M5U15_07410 [Kiritimatiellae bacterium]|nr:hypothetical protein [Kiritimatiellia bacterium]